MEILTIQKFIHSSPRKLRIVADMVRKMQPIKALDILKFTPKAGAKEIVKAIETSLASAKQAGLEQEVVLFKSLEINEGPKLRRFKAGSKGRALPFKRRMSHIKIVLTDEIGNKKVTSNKTEKKGNK